MKRKNFIEVIVPAAFALQSWRTLDSGQTKKGMPEVESVKPRYLSQGDTIGITCPAGFITAEEIQPAVAKLIEWDFNVKIGETVGKRNATFGGTDEERLADLQQMIDDKKISAILFGRGGYGAVRIVDKINFKKFIAHPKWILGFSDITTLHSHINKNFSIATIHSKMCNSFPADWSLADQLQIETIDSIRKCLLGEKM